MGTDITHYKQKLAEQAKAAADKEQLPGGTILSTRGGVLRYGEEELVGNQACVIVLDSMYENTFYQGKYDADNPSPPICYAASRELQEDMAPDETMQRDLNYFEPQAEECRKCPWNEWGSADQGRGKACQNRRRLSLIPAGEYLQKRGSRDLDLELFNSPKDFESAEIATIKLPVMSVKNWGKFVNQIAAAHNLPPHGVICRMFVVPDGTAQYKVDFEMIEAVPDELLPVVMKRAEEAANMPYQGYMPPEDKPAPQPAGRGSLRGLRR